jgi:hypothetical protein
MDGGEVRRIEAAALEGRRLKAFDIVMAAFVTVLLLSKVLGAGTVATLALPLAGEWPFGAGMHLTRLAPPKRLKPFSDAPDMRPKPAGSI